MTAVLEFVDKINIGCGYKKLPGFLNVDMDPLCEPDLLIKDGDLSALPKRHFSVLAAFDVLEHIRRSETASALLDWADLMEMGGRIEVETSNVLAIVDMMRKENKFAHHAYWTISMYGNQMHEGDYHHTGFSEITLRTYLAAAGFVVDELIHHMDWIMLVSGRKVEDWSALVENGSHLSDEDFVIAAYRQALDRTVEEPFKSLEVAWLADGTMTRRQTLKKLYSSHERALQAAIGIGY